MLRDQYRRARRTGKFQWRFSTLLNFLNFAELRKGHVFNYMEYVLGLFRILFQRPEKGAEVLSVQSLTEFLNPSKSKFLSWVPSYTEKGLGWKFARGFIEKG